MIKIKIIAIFAFILIISPLTISKETISEEFDASKKILNFINLIEEDDFYGNITESEIYLKFRSLVGNESKIGACGPAYINSTGKGLHAGRNIKIIQIEIPISIQGLFFNFLRFPRYMMGIWLIFAGYTDENATTKITPLTKDLKFDENKSINISGKHMVLSGVFFFREPVRMRRNLLKPILSSLTGIPKENITFPIEKLHGKNFLIFNEFPYSLLTTLQFFSPIKVKIPLYGFFKALTFQGYAPFVLWAGNSQS